MAGFVALNSKRPAEPADDNCSNSIPPTIVSPTVCLPSSASSAAARPLKRQASSLSTPSAFSNQPVIPTSAVTSPSNYGRMNAEDESNLNLLQDLSHDTSHRRARLPARGVTYPRGDLRSAARKSRVAGAVSEFEIKGPDMTPKAARKPTGLNSHHGYTLANLPPEIIDCILSSLPATDLCILSQTCRQFRKHALSDFQWLPRVQQNVPGQTLTRPNPFRSFHELYAAYDRVWFLPKYKIWFCDRDLTGKLIMIRYNAGQGCIEGHQLLAISDRTNLQYWAGDSDVVIHEFEPKVKLHLDKPVLRFDIQSWRTRAHMPTKPGANRFTDEMSMKLSGGETSMFSNFLLTKPLNTETADRMLASDYPYDNIWPPPTIPARNHVSGAGPGQEGPDYGAYDRPQSRFQVSDQTFKIRKWMEMPAPPAPPRVASQVSASGITQDLSGAQDEDTGSTAMGQGAIGVHIGEDVITYSTLDPVLYTPTDTKPWRGIWVGDYSGHGCEFLLINQPDDPPVSDAELGIIRQEKETDAEWEQRRRDAHMYRGRLEAIKLTGDPNVPRGEYTFVADDLGPGGYVGIAQDPPFTGSRVVKSKGHVAATGFVLDKYIESQLILIGHNRLAQYWVGFGHISYFERVNVDCFLAT